MKDTATTRRSFLKVLAAGGVGGGILSHAERLEARVSRLFDGVSWRADDADSLRRLRAQYLVSPDLVYLNHASIGTVPVPVLEAHKAYLELCESHPSLYVWGSVWREVTEEVRRSAASLLGCLADDLAITHNTTEGFNVLAHGLPLGPGDEVLFSSLNHGAASIPWQGLAERRGFTVRRFPFPMERIPSATVDEIVDIHLEAIRPETRALVFPHVDNVVGMLHPMREIAEAATGRGVDYVLVDGAQSAGMAPVDLADSGVSAYATSPHKWLQAPKGLGLLYVSEALRSNLPRMWHRTASDFGGSARSFEDYSTRAWPAVVTLGDALAFQAALGADEKSRRYAALRARVLERVDATEGLSWRSPRARELSSVIVSVGVSGPDAPSLGERLLAEHGIVLRAFGPPYGTLRLSPNVATDDARLARVLDVLADEAS